MTCLRNFDTRQTFITISAGVSASCGVRADGTIIGWGNPAVVRGVPSE